MRFLTEHVVLMIVTVFLTISCSKLDFEENKAATNLAVVTDGKDATGSQQQSVSSEESNQLNEPDLKEPEGKPQGTKIDKFERIYQNDYSFVGFGKDGKVKGWGYKDRGADVSSIEGKLKLEDIREVYANKFAYAAVKNDGSVVTWGDSQFGGDSSEVQEQLVNVDRIYPTEEGFIAVLDDQSIVIWGSGVLQSGKTPATLTYLKNNADRPSGKVKEIYNIPRSSLLLLEDGNVMLLGASLAVGFNSTLQEYFKSHKDKIVEILPVKLGAFVALFTDGTVRAFGAEAYGGSIEYPEKEGTTKTDLLNSKFVTHIYTNGKAVAALQEDGSVVVWGYGSYGGQNNAYEFSDLAKYEGNIQPAPLRGISSVFTDNANGFLGFKAGRGPLMAWGHASFGGMYSVTRDKDTKEVTKVSHTTIYGGKSETSHPNHKECDFTEAGKSRCFAKDYFGKGEVITQVEAASEYGVTGAYSVLVKDGSDGKVNYVVSWGDANAGGYQAQRTCVYDEDTQKYSCIQKAYIINYLVDRNVEKIYHTNRAFAAKFSDGSLITWGNSMFGGVVEKDRSNPASWYTSFDSDGNIVGLTNIDEVVTNKYAFVAKRSDGALVSWGHPKYGGDSWEVRDLIDGSVEIKVENIYKNELGFLVKREDGVVVYWGSDLPR